MVVVKVFVIFGVIIRDVVLCGVKMSEEQVQVQIYSQCNKRAQSEMVMS